MTDRSHPCPTDVPPVNPLGINLSHLSYLSYPISYYVWGERIFKPRRCVIPIHTHPVSKNVGQVGHAHVQRVCG